MAFLTDLDSRAAIKGSRDPLATQMIWVPLGRKVVGNLTTVTTSVRDFTVLLLGFWFLERAREEGSEEDDLALFLKFEQLAAYARVEANIKGFRGVDRARSNASHRRVTLSAERTHQILGNQKIYGLWGLYTVAARSSGLLSDDPMRLTARAREFVESTYIRRLAKDGFRDGNAVVKLLVPRSVRLDLDGREAGLVKSLGAILRPDRISDAERAFYDEVLVRGGPDDQTDGRQTRLAALLQATLKREDFEFTPSTIDQLAKAANDQEQPGSLSLQLTRIRHCETMLAPAVRLFLFLLGQNGKDTGEVADVVRKTWGPGLKHLDLQRIQELKDELASIMDGTEGAERWIAIASDLSTGRYQDVIERLIAHNKLVMQQRGGAAPWIELRGGRLHVAFRDEDGRLPPAADLPSLWRSSYFIDSLRTIVGQVRGGAS